MKTRTASPVVLLISLALLAGGAITTASAGAATPAPAAAARTPFGVYYWKGSAKIVDDVTGKTRWVKGSGVILAATDEEARQIAKETMESKASKYGTVLKVYVDELW